MPSDFNNPAVASHSESSKAAAGVGIAAAYERPPPSAPATTIHSRMRAPTDTNGHQARRTLAETQTKAIGPSEAQCAPDEQDPPGKRRLEEAGDDFAGPSAATKRLKQQDVKAPSERAATSGERPAAPSGSHSHLPAVSVTQRMVPAKQNAPPASSRPATVAPNGQVRRPPKAASSGLFVPKKKVRRLLFRDVLFFKPTKVGRLSTAMRLEFPGEISRRRVAPHLEERQATSNGLHAIATDCETYPANLSGSLSQ